MRMSNMRARNRSNMSLFIMAAVALFALAVCYNIFQYNQTKNIIEKYQCVPTDRVTQEFSSGSNGSVDSVTKVFYECKDRGRWLTSYDTLDAILGK